MSDEITIYEIPAQNIGGLMAKIEKVSKKSKKINGKPVVLDILEEVSKPRQRVASDGSKTPILDADGNQTYNIFYKVSVNAEPVKIAGWTFIATIDHQASGNLLRVVPNVKCEIPEKYRTIGPVCDHCNKIRGRRDTFLLRCDADGSLKQIGRQCIRDFIGYDVAQFLAMAECYSDAVPSSSDGDGDDWLGGGMRDRRYIPVNTFLCHVSAVMRKFGWCSKKRQKSR